MSDLLNTLYHNCRSCKWFKDEKCLHDDIISGYDPAEIMLKLSEDGYVSGAIEESFTDGDFSDVKAALSETRLSRKKIDEIMKILHDEVKANQADWTQSIDDGIFHLMLGFEVKGFDGFELESPGDFYCKYFE